MFIACSIKAQLNPRGVTQYRYTPVAPLGLCLMVATFELYTCRPAGAVLFTNQDLLSNIQH